jgi:hypothetical protein
LFDPNSQNPFGNTPQAVDKNINTPVRQTDPLDQNRFDNGALERELGSVLRNHDGNDPAKTFDALDSLSRTLRPSAGKAIDHTPAAIGSDAMAPGLHSSPTPEPQGLIDLPQSQEFAQPIKSDDWNDYYDHPTSMPKVNVRPPQPVDPRLALLYDHPTSQPNWKPPSDEFYDHPTSKPKVNVRPPEPVDPDLELFYDHPTSQPDWKEKQKF